MSIDGARAAFVGAFYEFVSPKVKQIAGDVEVWARDSVIFLSFSP